MVLGCPFPVILAFDQAERLETALEEHVPWVSFSWGLNAELIARARAGAAQVLVQVASASEARDAVGAGADALIVQGVEAGGHVQSSQALLQLLAEVRAGVSVPIVAAGGIADPETARVAMPAGADVVSMGTRFAACEESLAHPRDQARLVDATGNDTVLTDLFDVGWAAPHRDTENPSDPFLDARRAAKHRASEKPLTRTYGGRWGARTHDRLPVSLPENASHITAPAQRCHDDERDEPWQAVILGWILGCASSTTAEQSAAACADRIEHDPARDRGQGHRSVLSTSVATTISTDREAVYSRSSV